MQISFDQFIEKYKGKAVGYPDGQYVGECLSLVKWYIKECFNINPPPSGSNSAYGYWSNFPSPLGTVFRKIPDAKGIVPSRGDIVIWNTNAGGGYGHIAICLSASTSSEKFTSLDQNWYGKAAEVKTHLYTNVIGWLHPLNSTMPEKTYTEAEMTQVRLERDKNWNLYQDALKEVEQYKSEAAARKQDYERFIEDLAKKLVLPATSDKNDILAAIDRLIEVEDQLNQANKNLQKTKETYEFEKKEMQVKIDQLREQIETQQKQNETLLARLDDLEIKLKQSQQQSEFVNRFSLIIKNLLDKLKGKNA